MAVVQRRVAGLQLDGGPHRLAEGGLGIGHCGAYLRKSEWCTAGAVFSCRWLCTVHRSACIIPVAVPSRPSLPTAALPVGLAAAAAPRARSRRRSVRRGGTPLPYRGAAHPRFRHRRWGFLRPGGVPALLLDSPTREHSGRTVVITPSSLRGHRQIDSREPPCYTRCHRIGPLPGGSLFLEWVAVLWEYALLSE